jgi:hypothetical protein
MDCFYNVKLSSDIALVSQIKIPYIGNWITQPSIFDTFSGHRVFWYVSQIKIHIGNWITQPSIFYMFSGHHVFWYAFRHRSRSRERDRLRHRSRSRERHRSRSRDRDRHRHRDIRDRDFDRKKRKERFVRFSFYLNCRIFFVRNPEIWFPLVLLIGWHTQPEKIMRSQQKLGNGGDRWHWLKLQCWLVDKWYRPADVTRYTAYRL